AFSMTARGKAPVRSCSFATGAITSRANLRAVSRRAICSGVSWKSISFLPPGLRTRASGLVSGASAAPLGPLAPTAAARRPRRLGPGRQAADEDLGELLRVLPEVEAPAAEQPGERDLVERPEDRAPHRPRIDLRADGAVLDAALEDR